MGILERLFGNSGSKPVPVDTIHPIFGSIYMDTDSSWFAETSDPFGCKGNPSLSIDGDDTGPFLASVDTFRQLRDNWTSIASTIAETLLELNHNYFSNLNPNCSMYQICETFRIRLKKHSVSNSILTFPFFLE